MVEEEVSLNIFNSFSSFLSPKPKLNISILLLLLYFFFNFKPLTNLYLVQKRILLILKFYRINQSFRLYEHLYLLL